MQHRSKYRESFLAIRAALQKHDPTGTMANSAGDPWDDQIYGFEATTILERLRGDCSATDIEKLLQEWAVNNRRQVHLEGLKNAAAEISEVLRAL
jgi:hypothetical protein